MSNFVTKIWAQLSKNLQLRRTIFVILLAHTVLLLVNLPSVYFTNAQSEQPADWWVLTVRVAWGIYVWALITPFILWLGYYFPIARANLIRNIFIHLAASVCAGVLRVVVFDCGLWAMGLSSLENVSADLSKLTTFIQSITGAMVHYPAIIGIYQAYLYFRESQDRAFHLQQAELKALKSQLNPHFLFNTLNAISALVYRSPEEADRTITQLSDLLRKSLEGGKTEEVSLEEELDFLRAYLQIHQTLMNKRLAVEWNVAPETLSAAVPNMILQPLVENAVEHGIAPLKQGGRIEINAHRNNGTLHLEVRDNGRGLTDKDLDAEQGIGLSNTRARLRFLYADKQEFVLTDANEGGLNVSIKIPFRIEPNERKNED